MRVSKLINLAILTFVTVLAAWLLFIGPPGGRPGRYDSMTLLLAFLFLLALFGVNKCARDYERPLVSVLIILNLMWIFVRFLVFLMLDFPWRFDDAWPSGVAEVNLTLLFLILALISCAFGVRIGSAVWLSQPGRHVIDTDFREGRMPFKMPHLLAFGYVVVGYHVIFSYFYRQGLLAVSEAESGIPVWSYWLITLLNHDVTLLWIFAFAVTHWRGLSKRERFHIVTFVMVFIAVYMSKNLLFQLAMLFMYALLTKRREPGLSPRALALLVALMMVFVPVYVGTFEMARVERDVTGVAGQRLGIATVMDGLWLLAELDAAYWSTDVVNSGTRALGELGARLDNLLLLLNVEPRGDYLSVWYAIKRGVNILTPRLRPFPDALLPQSLVFKVGYGVATKEDAATYYVSDALPALGVYYSYFGGIGAIATLFLTGVGFSWLYRKAAMSKGARAPIMRVYCLYFFGQLLFGMGVDSVAAQFVYTGVLTGALILIWLMVLERGRRSRVTIASRVVVVS